MGESPFVRSAGYTYATEAAAHDAFAAASGAAVFDCLKKAIKAGDGEDGVRIKEVTGGALNVKSSADETAAYRLSLTVTNKGFDVGFSADYVCMRVGRATLAQVYSDLSTFDPALEEATTAASVMRARKAVG